MEQISMFDLLMPTFKINKPLRLIEFFAGYGSQALALKYLGAKFEHWKICEWALPSIIAYASLHRNELAFYDKDFSQQLSKNEIAEYLFKKGVSIDYNQPATLDQLKRVTESKLRLCYNAIQCTHNLVDISRVKGKNLDIEETDKYTYLLTYSFPCQDLSLAGKGKGMEKGSGTRSGLLWEVERILSECEIRPQVLVMENVTQVHGAGNEEHFKQWMLRLEEMGYQSYWNDMSATEYGIPQTRNRTFMVSVLGDYNYKFPKKTKLKLRLKDMLESNVDEKFYLSQKMIEYISAVGGGITQTTIQKSTSKSQDHLQQSKTKGQEQQITCPRSFPEEFDLSGIEKPSFNEVYDKLKNSNFQQQKNRIQEQEVCDTLLARDYKDPKCIVEKEIVGTYDYAQSDTFRNE
jgi:DNA (cytosine-5)-methyltransferase 1